MHRSLRLLIAIAVLLPLRDTRAGAQAGGQSENDHAKVIAAAPGRIEGSAQATEIGASIGGIVEKVLVKQGDTISVGQPLVRIDCSDIAAQLEQRKAEYDAVVALYEKLVNGPRPQEIEVAKADLELAQARLAEAQSRFARSQNLLTRDSINRSDYDIAQRDSQMAPAQLAAAQSRLQLLQAGTREEESCRGQGAHDCCSARDSGHAS